MRWPAKQTTINHPAGFLQHRPVAGEKHCEHENSEFKLLLARRPVTFKMNEFILI